MIKQKSCKNEDDELIQTRRKRLDKFVSKCNRKPQPQLVEKSQEQKLVKDREDGLANVYERNHYQTETETGSLISDYDNDVYLEQNYLNQYFTEHQLQENQLDAAGKDLWKQLEKLSLPIFDGKKKNYNNWKEAFMAYISKAPASAEYKH